MEHLETSEVVVFLLVGVGVGFLSYGYLLIQSGGWGDVSNIHDLLRFFFRIDYGTFQITHEVDGSGGRHRCGI